MQRSTQSKPQRMFGGLVVLDSPRHRPKPIPTKAEQKERAAQRAEERKKRSAEQQRKAYKSSEYQWISDGEHGQGQRTVVSGEVSGGSSIGQRVLEGVTLSVRQRASREGNEIKKKEISKSERQDDPSIIVMENYPSDVDDSSSDNQL